MAWQELDKGCKKIEYLPVSALQSPERERNLILELALPCQLAAGQFGS